MPVIPSSTADEVELKEYLELQRAYIEALQVDIIALTTALNNLI